MSQVQKRRIGFLLAPIVTISACTIAFMYYSGVEAAPPRTGPSLEEEAPSFQVGGFSRPAEEGGTIPRPTQYTYAMQIGPIAGLTTAWHEAPPLTAIPRGTVLEFRKAGLSMAQITWTGAQEVRREGDDSIAECSLQELGTSLVTVRVTRPGGYEREHRCELYVVDTPVEEITLAPLEVSVAPLPVDENSSNQTTMQYFFARDSIAQFTQVGPAHYRTSIDKRITFAAQTVPAGFEPLMEWRRNGSIIGLGAALEDYVIVTPGSNVFTVGPPAAPEQIQIDTYGVTITSHATGQNSISEGEPVTFTAVTDPPGYEDDITWLSTTKYGTGTPILGTGPTFTVQFDDTWGPHPDGGLWQWLGVRADNARVGQDQLGGACCFDQDFDGVREKCIQTTPEGCIQNAGLFQGLGTKCQPVEACCFPVNHPLLPGVCLDMDPECCALAGGTADGPGFCGPEEACCFPVLHPLLPGVCIDMDPDCCILAGGTADGPGFCGPVEACCFPVNHPLLPGVCLDMDPECCMLAGGMPAGPGGCMPAEACCFPANPPMQPAVCIDMDPNCCMRAGGTPRIGETCGDNGCQCRIMLGQVIEENECDNCEDPPRRITCVGSCTTDGGQCPGPGDTITLACPDGSGEDCVYIILNRSCRAGCRDDP